ncbi:hypothetical protein D3C81_2106200 [compost metagenome]
MIGKDYWTGARRPNVFDLRDKSNTHILRDGVHDSFTAVQLHYAIEFDIKFPASFFNELARSRAPFTQNKFFAADLINGNFTLLHPGVIFGDNGNNRAASI